MTMIPTESLSKVRQYHNFHSSGYGYGSGCSGVMSRFDHEEYCSSEAAAAYSNCLLGSDHHHQYYQMADQDESRTNVDLNEEAIGSSASKDNTNINTVTNITTSNQDQEEIIRRRDEGSNWLQLSIGGHTTTRHANKHRHHDHQVVDQTAERRGGGGLLELDLLAGGSSSSHHQGIRPLLLAPRPPPIFHDHDQYFRAPHHRPMMITSNLVSTNPSLFFHQQQQQQASSSSMFAHNREISWAFRPNLAAAASSSSVSTSSLLPYFARPFQLQSGAVMDVGGGAGAGPSSDFRVIDPPPRRPHSGIWFLLQASQNQAKEPFLPQIPKSYLRIKDGRMTVRLLTKYLVNKLRLDSESEIEITCKGHQLQPFLTLQHVRDTIWSPRDSVTLLPDSSTTDHVMVLHYGRSP